MHFCAVLSTSIRSAGTIDSVHAFSVYGLRSLTTRPLLPKRRSPLVVTGFLPRTATPLSSISRTIRSMAIMTCPVRQDVVSVGWICAVAVTLHCDRWPSTPRYRLLRRTASILQHAPKPARAEAYWCRPMGSRLAASFAAMWPTTTSPFHPPVGQVDAVPWRQCARSLLLVAIRCRTAPSARLRRRKGSRCGVGSYVLPVKYPRKDSSSGHFRHDPL